MDYYRGKVKLEINWISDDTFSTQNCQHILVTVLYQNTFVSSVGFLTIEPDLISFPIASVLQLLLFIDQVLNALPA